MLAQQMSVLGRLLQAIEETGARYALVGGHAVSAHTRPRLTVDVDIVIETRKQAAVERALAVQGFRTLRERDVLRVFEAGELESPAVADLLLADSHPVWAEALRTATPGVYQGQSLPLATVAALVAMKFVAAASLDRPQEDRLQDVSDISRLVKTRWTDADAAETRRIAELAHPGAAADLDRLISDLLAGRPVTI
jgi:hypothetical protein